MKIVLQGEIYDLGEATNKAFELSVQRLGLSNPELVDEISDNAEKLYISRAEVDFNFVIDSEVSELTAKHNGVEEILTMVYDVDDSNEDETVVTFARTNDDSDPEGKPVFSDTERAIMDASKGFEEVEETLDVTGADKMFEGQKGGLKVELYANGYAKFYENDKLIQELIVPEDRIVDFVNYYSNLCK